jgi:hypothetical protein
MQLVKHGYINRQKMGFPIFGTFLDVLSRENTG